MAKSINMHTSLRHFSSINQPNMSLKYLIETYHNLPFKFLHF